jgi:monoamine oxidase
MKVRCTFSPAPRIALQRVLVWTRFLARTMASYQGSSCHYDTIIIGAGMSGLACASRLLEHSSYQTEKRLLILEARDRIGGRIEAVRLNGSRLDTGANWIHGVGTDDDPNPLVQILPNKRFKELSRMVSFRTPTSTYPTKPVITELQTENDWVNVDSSEAASSKPPEDDLVIPAHISGDIFGALWEMIGSLHEQASKTSIDSAYKTSMLEAVSKDDAFKSAFDDVPVEYHQTLRGLPQFIENMEAGPLYSSSAEHGEDHATMGLLEFALDDFDGDQVFLQDGYTALIEEVGRDVIKKSHIRLGVEVQDISWSTGPIVISTNGGQHTADRVVCTIPLGVLKSHTQPKLHPSSVRPLFTPELPPENVTAIQSLGFGTLDKIFMVYNDPWWTEEPYVSILKKGLVDRPILEDDDPSTNKDNPTEPDSLWGFTDELAGLDIGPDGTVQSGLRALSVINLHALTGFPVLSSFISCVNAVHIEGLSNHAASMIVHRSLTKWFGHEPPLPEAVHVTRWAQDKYSRGSYTHMITGLSKNSHREIFQTPLVNKDGAELRFAGEHSSQNHFATVHGALLSGWREADAIIESVASAVG